MKLGRERVSQFPGSVTNQELLSSAQRGQEPGAAPSRDSLQLSLETGSNPATLEHCGYTWGNKSVVFEYPCIKKQLQHRVSRSLCQGIAIGM